MAMSVNGCEGKDKTQICYGYGVKNFIGLKVVDSEMTDYDNACTFNSILLFRAALLM